MYSTVSPLSKPIELQRQYQAMLASGEASRFQQRLAVADASMWPGDEQVRSSIRQRLGWLSSIDLMCSQASRILDCADKARTLGFRHCVLMGMGGSSLAPEVFSQVFDKPEGRSIGLEILDNTAPQAIHNVAAGLDWASTLFIIASKSGTTIESDSLYRYFYQQLAGHGQSRPGRQFIAITDSNTPLAEVAQSEEFLDCFINPSDIGGRFSVLSYFGLLPASLVGVDIVRLLESASTEQASLDAGNQTVADATRLGLAMGLAQTHGLDKLLVDISPALYPFAAWLEQLVAESTGKDGKGLLPIIRQGRKNITGMDVSVGRSLAAPVNPIYRRDLTDPYHLGAEFFRWEWATAIAGAVMEINPFDEPNVSENKRVTLEVLQMAGDHSGVFRTGDVAHVIPAGPEQSCPAALEDALKKFADLINAASETDYVAVLAYGSDGARLESATRDFRKRLAAYRKVASTFGQGPRYLHSTGQLHKGGVNNGIFLLITAQAALDLEIPGQTYSFAELNRAQATGDLQVLLTRGRRIVHIHLPDEGAATLNQLKIALGGCLFNQ